MKNNLIEAKIETYKIRKFKNSSYQNWQII
jgi:hypothetical protein